MKRRVDPSSPGSASVDLTDALAQLQAKSQGIAWPQRRQLVTQIAGPLSDGPASEPFRSILLLLAEDSKWEVRRDVARVLAGVPDHELAGIAQRLADDEHPYVRKAAEHSIKKWRERARESQRRKRGVDLVLELYNEIEEDHGKPAATKARRLAESLYDTLISAIVHEMRNVLTALKEDNARIIEHQEAGSLDAGFLRRKSAKMADRLAFMERLLADMRNYAQPVSGDRHVVSVANLLTEARSMVSENLKARNTNPRKVKLCIQVPPDVCVMASRVHLVTALVNILRNAYDFLPADGEGPHGQISIRVTPKGKQVQIAIQDDGQGIPAGSLEEIRQCLPGRTSRRHGGTGFGLCNARRFVEAHGGSLRIDSKENEGTTITLVLPVA